VTDKGQMVNGWSLDVSTTDISCCDAGALPSIIPGTVPTDTTTPEDTPKVITFNVEDGSSAPVTPSANLVVTATSSNQGVVPNGNISVGTVGSSGTQSIRSLTITPAPNVSGSGAETTITITVTDANNLSRNYSFKLSVTPVNDNPTISALIDQSGQKNMPTTPQSFTISDIETAASDLAVFANS